MPATETNARAFLAGGNRGKPISTDQFNKHFAWLDNLRGVKPGTSDFNDLADHMAQYLEDQSYAYAVSLAQDQAKENVPDF